MANVIGVDIGGTNIEAGKVENGKVVAYAHKPTPKTRKKFIEAVFSVIGGLKDNGTKAVGIGFPAPVAKGRVHEVNNIPSLNNTNLKSIVERKFRIKCSVDNDANAFALAEARFGAAKGIRHVVGITLGTGVGCGIVINGKIYSGNTGAAGEISRIPVDGTRLEEYANRRFLKKISGMEGKELYELAKKGSRKALNAWKIYGRNVGRVISVVVDTVDPEMVVLGGKISLAFPFFRKEMNAEIKKLCFKRTYSKLRVVQSKIIKDSAILGAASLC